MVELPSFPVEPTIESSIIPPMVQSPVECINFFAIGTPEPTTTFKWFRGGTEIAGETGSTYTPLSSDIGFTLSAEVTATNAAGSAVATAEIEFPVQDVALSMSSASIVSPVFSGGVATTVNNAVGYDVIEYNWQANTGGDYFSFSTDSEKTDIPAAFEGFDIKCVLTAIRSGFSSIAITTNPVTVSAASTPASGSYAQEGVLEPGSGYGSSFIEKSTTKIVGDSNLFACDSHPIFRLGTPSQYPMDSSGFTLDMYAFHGSGIS